jgi:membrane associated rhomboid family serine protease
LVSARRTGNPFAFGGRVPAAVGGLIAATVVVSLVAVVGERNGFPLLQLFVLAPRSVWGGEVWRLVTWALVETEPLNLLFGGLVLFWFGRDLVEAWGERRFLATYFGIAAAAGALTCLAALAWPELLAFRFTGFWAAVDAVIVAWALLHPFRQILLFFAVPVSGKTLLWITVGGTVLFALFAGVAAFVPHLLAEGVAWVWVSGKGPGQWLRRLRLPRLRRRGRFEVIRADRDPDRNWLN